MKKCTKCAEEKDLSLFYKDKLRKDGYFPWCKKCSAEHYKKWRERNSERCAVYCRKYFKRPYAREMHSQITRDWRNKFPERERAHQKVNDAVRYGKMRRESCSVCGNPKSEAHHEDYDKPLDVIWLCSKHHRERHRTYR